MLKVSRYLELQKDPFFMSEAYPLNGLKYIVLGLQKNYCLCTQDKCERSGCGIQGFFSDQKCFNSCLHYHNPHLNIVEPIPSHIGYNSMVMVKCEKCGYVWEVLAKSVLYGNRGCKCKMSKGERIVSEILDKLGIKYLYNKTIKGYGIRPDFQLVDFDYAIIEVDGRQHRESVSLFGGETEYKKTQNRDEKKNQYCIDNKIPILRLSDVDSPVDMEGKVKDFIILINKSEKPLDKAKRM